MSDFFHRQFSILREAEADYHSKAIGLNELVARIEAIGRVLGGELWEAMFEIVLDLELINSEVIEKKRGLTHDEQLVVSNVLASLNAIILKKESDLE